MPLAPVSAAPVLSPTITGLIVVEKSGKYFAKASIDLFFKLLAFGFVIN